MKDGGRTGHLSFRGIMEDERFATHRDHRSFIIPGEDLFISSEGRSELVFGVGGSFDVYVGVGVVGAGGGGWAVLDHLSCRFSPVRCVSWTIHSSLLPSTIYA